MREDRTGYENAIEYNPDFLLKKTREGIYYAEIARTLFDDGFENLSEISRTFNVSFATVKKISDLLHNTDTELGFDEKYKNL